MKSFYDLARTRRTIRNFTDEPVSDDDLNYVLKSALTAPSSFGRHPVEYVVIRNKKSINDIADAKTMGAYGLRGADVAVVVMVNQNNLEFWIEDGAIAASYIYLAGTERNLAVNWTEIRHRSASNGTSDEAIRGLLNVPNNYEVLCVMALGHKAEEKAPYTERDLPFDNVHYGHF